jgi:hypothetical protein
MRIGLSLGLTQPLGKGTPAVPVFPPVNTVLPAITGTTSVGSVLTVSNGTWTNTPLSYTRQWLRDGAAISGATAATYTLVAGDEGKMISATVTATNADGSGSAAATAVGPITAAPAIKTYAEFQTYAATQAAEGVLDWYDAFPAGDGTYRSTAKNTNPTFTSLTGTSWGPSSASGFARAVSSVSGVAIHGFTTQALIDAQVAAGREIMFKITALTPNGAVIALARNGLTSLSSPSTSRSRLDEIKYFDDTLGPVVVDPFNGTGPTPFTWP